MRPLPVMLVLLGSAAVVVAEPPSSADRQFFERKVRPVFVERCQRCHSIEAKKHKGGLLLDSRAAILRGGDSGPAVVPGRPDDSRLIQAVHYRQEKLQMPPKGKLPPAEIAVLEEWVRRGAPFPGPDAVRDKSAVSLAEGRRFWSFQPLQRGVLPRVLERSWPERRIDSFILVGLEREKIAPSPEAAPRTLIRRAYFDLLGLPPSPLEVEAFVADRSADAYPRLVERLLASPLYGERWARYWLDLARYCDLPEPWAELKGQPWRYRDWVVQAFNDDLPYDRFVQLQLAADLLPDAAPRDRAALGFLGLSPVYWKELKLDKDVIRGVVAEEWEERIQAVTGTFLGLTVACARCHDHKFDPITTQDYYALAGVFASIRQTDLGLLSEAETSAALEARSKIRALEDEFGKLQGSRASAAEKASVQARIESLKRTSPYTDVPRVPGVAEASLHVQADGAARTRLVYKPGEAHDVAVQIRGNPASTGPVVPRRFLAVLSPAAPNAFKQGSGRRELARAIVTDAAPLAARVLVNRVWKHHFGAGLVETTSDFGAQGERPSHPQLLDDLAARFIEHGWSIKWLHREIMLSAVYRQVSSLPHSASRDPQTKDPANRLLWRMNRRRLNVEAWRDAMLAVAGTLRLQAGGPALELSDSANNRRSLYGKVKRRELTDLLRLFDFPDPTAHSPARLPTTTPLQQLFVLNSPFLQQQSAALVKRLKAETPNQVEPRVQRAYELLFGRHATAAQLRRATEFLTAGKSSMPVGDTLWEQFAQVLLGSNEFLFID